MSYEDSTAINTINNLVRRLFTVMDSVASLRGEVQSLRHERYSMVCERDDARQQADIMEEQLGPALEKLEAAERSRDLLEGYTSHLKDEIACHSAIPPLEYEEWVSRTDPL